jgi:type IV pilus assembly protein PilO
MAMSKPFATSKPAFDSSPWQSRIRTQFAGLDPNDPSRWPTFPRYLLLGAMAIAVMVVLWFVWLGDMGSQLESERSSEAQLRADYTRKLGQAANLDVLKDQLEQVRQFVTQLERQLPSNADMESLLSDISQAGQGRSLTFELIRPEQVVFRDFYVELPITMRVTGSYHDIGLFVSDISHLSRIVTINNIELTPVQNRNDLVTMDAIAKTFRYLDPEEAQKQRSGAAK